ncbi:Uncharacterized protein ycf33 [Apostasia shenzhenica]|uniref:Uncharacterized protein ycf33 n=1 Tax=Apostasia shenzhenica TaxID=1088818 RepID=A0A2I0A2D3_9ASPA|nr:Uncharacterized protein ycf33 [Apostasia shenzhenica]
MKACSSRLVRPHFHPAIHGHQLHLCFSLSFVPSTTLRPNPSARSTGGINSPSVRNLGVASAPSKVFAEKDLLPEEDSSNEGLRRLLLLAGFSFALGFLVLGFGGEEKAMALGPEGPLMEEFWDNVRRYGLYIITVSTGAIYTILQPILELLKNPITAILIVIVFVGSFYLLSQVLSAMVGVSEFSYDYGY